MAGSTQLVLRQGDLADLTGVTRETADRILADLRGEGLVDFVSDHHIVLRDVARLRSL